MNGRSDLGVAWITGAGKGIGRALALQLAASGWAVAISARTASDLAAVAAEAPSGRIHCHPLDVTDLPATRECIKQIENTLGPIDLAVLNAGTHRAVSATNFSVEAFRDLFETNMMGTVHGLAEILPRFTTRRSGRIAVVASVAGYRGLPTAAAYGATKAGLINMCEALKPELDRCGVTIQVINPGFVDTPLTARNDFAMPCLVTAEMAADCIVRGFAGSAFEIAFPKRFVLLMKLLRLLPNRLFFAISRRLLPA